MNKVVLVSPLHDPEGRLSEYTKTYASKLNKIYSNLIRLSVTPATSKEIINTLTSLKIPFEFIDNTLTKNIGANYKNAINLGIKTDAFIHQVDFDRALHWVESFPKELENVVNELKDKKGFVSMVRTKRAFETHPLTQRLTEVTINSIASEAAGIDIDIMSGSYGFENALARLIVEEGKHNDYGFYAETLEIALKHKFPISVIEVEGLEWETPDQYKDVIEKDGYIKWLSDFQSLPEWEKRVKLIEKSAEVLTKQ